MAIFLLHVIFLLLKISIQYKRLSIKLVIIYIKLEAYFDGMNFFVAEVILVLYLCDSRVFCCGIHKFNLPAL